MSENSDNERRKHERKAFDSVQSKVDFKLKDDNDHHHIYEVHDVSISGMRVSIAETQLEAGQELVLQVSEADFALSVNAVVRWTAPGAEADLYEHGIEFDASEMDLNILLFMYLRKNLSELS